MTTKYTKEILTEVWEDLESKYECEIYTAFETAFKALDESEELWYKLNGVMYFVDKWLDGDELKYDEVQRASLAREKALQIIEGLTK